MDQSGCFGATCTGLKNQAFKEANKCSVPVTVAETTEGCKCERNSPMPQDSQCRKVACAKELTNFQG